MDYNILHFHSTLKDFLYIDKGNQDKRDTLSLFSLFFVNLLLFLFPVMSVMIVNYSLYRPELGIKRDKRTCEHTCCHVHIYVYLMN